MAVVISRIISFSALLACLSISGCGSGYDWDGTFEGQRNYKTQPGQDSAMAFTLGKVHLKIDRGEYQLIDGGVPSSGRTKSMGEKLGLLADIRMSQRVTLHDDGVLTPIDRTTVEFRGTGADSNPIKLNRVKSGQ